MNQRVLATLALCLCLCSATAVTMMGWFDRGEFATNEVLRFRLWFYSLTALTFLCAWQAARHARLRIALMVELATFSAVAVVPSLAIGLGIHAPALPVLCLTIVLTGLICGQRETWCISAALATTVILLWLGERQGWLSVSHAEGSGTEATARLVALLFAYISCGWLISTYGVAFRAALTQNAQALEVAEAARAESEAQQRWLSFVTDAAPVLIIYWTADWRCGFVNRAMADLFSRDSVSMMGCRYDEVIPADIAALNRPLIATAMRGEALSFARTLPTRRGPRHFVGHYLPHSQGDLVLGVLAVAWDVTDLRDMEQALEQRTCQAEAASVAKSQFLAAMSHELRTPLNGILGMGQLLEMPGLSDAERGEFTASLLHSARQLQTLTDKVLNYARLESGEARIEPREFHLPTLLDETHAVHALAARAKGLTMALNFTSAAEVQLWSDPALLRQALGELLDNAVKFSEAGHVALQATRLDIDGREFIEIAVVDEGIGISDEGLAQVFESFSQVDGSRTRRHGGTGLGLALVRRLVELLGGHAGVESRLGEGSRFWLRIPLKQSAEARD